MQDKAHSFLCFRIILNALERSRSRKRGFQKRAHHQDVIHDCQRPEVTLGRLWTEFKV